MRAAQHSVPGERRDNAHLRYVPRTPQEQEMVKREIESTNKAIDKLVYELYGLSEEEMRIRLYRK